MSVPLKALFCFLVSPCHLVTYLIYSELCLLRDINTLNNAIM